ncbi:SGNH/GDSL hydrolase family protein [Nocardioides sp. zg-1228]|uniref:SGNH/GDSL hydrolase family protein n=1 Tax=Nocardioides sp. zg-1228 TaxID=2763008 RepID=UPI001642709A|nr:SGNH/GDSL hydrolase family protein [Nocardioides sp. zg-1228]MBC2931800.1 SGNH/GDSL hydrolase family protein [Nocardioides sp. zg-1228]QSF57376.1 SGNH/GDSL hydrolase family protein [Nocardioides sp. zg-1228]
MPQAGSPRRVAGASGVVLLLAALLAFYVADVAGAGPSRCQQHRVEARERARAVTGDGSPVLVVGDSWSVGLGLDDPVGSWASRLPGEVHVRGFSGSGFSARASGCGRVSFHDRAPTALGVRPQLVVVAGGLNDYDQPARAIDRGFRALMADLRGHHVVVVGPASAPLRAGAVPRVDEQLARLAALYGVPYVPTGDLDLDYLDDRLHLTAGGHRAFGDAVAARLADVRPTRPAVLAR